jgi:CheY-like chemotaxis protein
MITKEVSILLAEDDDGHAALITKNLRRSGLCNDVIRFKNGQEILDFLFLRGDGPHRSPQGSYIMLLDIRMPVLDGIQVLKQMKEDPELAKIPVTMLTTTDDPKDVQECFRLGCSNYITKPIDYTKFVEVIKQLGLFLMVVEAPTVKVIRSVNQPCGDVEGNSSSQPGAS